MSGVGKTTLAQLLRKDGWFHYSIDYRIGTHYMGEHIVDNFKKEAMKVPFLRDLLLSDSIYISSNLTFDNCTPVHVSGQAWRSQEAAASASRNIAAVRHCTAKRKFPRSRTCRCSSRRREKFTVTDQFICDSGGSLCEIVDPAVRTIAVVARRSAEHTLLLYIRGTEDHARMLVERFRQ